MVSPEQNTEVEELLLRVASEIDRMDGLMVLMDRTSGPPRGGSSVSGAIRRAISKRRQEKLMRACIACPEVYHGGLICPKCGEFGEPLDVGAPAG